MSSERINSQANRSMRPFSDPMVAHRARHSRTHHDTRRPLRVMKFGGTSIADASCIRKAAEIVKSTAWDGELVVVVSAMSGVTNKLIDATVFAEAGNRSRTLETLEDLRQQHEQAIQILIYSEFEKNRLRRRIHDLIDECAGRCERTVDGHELTPSMRDSILAVGERLVAPIFAATLTAHGLVAEALEATELIVTDSAYGCADPRMDLTVDRCERSLRPLLRRGTIPVVTGFIAANEDGSLTTLGRGGSDYSATIVGSALKANEVIIWTDVDGILTADPRFVPNAATIPEISYREASELAYYGAKVLHPKTLRPVMEAGIPVWVRNTFAPEKKGTKITSIANANRSSVKAVTGIKDVALIRVVAPVTAAQDALPRMQAVLKAAPCEVLMAAKSSMDEISLVVTAALAQRSVEALQQEFYSEIPANTSELISVDSSASILTVVGEDLRTVKEIVRCAEDELSRNNVSILAMAQGTSACNVSLVVARKDFDTALAATHRELERSTTKKTSPGSSPIGNSRYEDRYARPEHDDPASELSGSAAAFANTAKELDEETFRSMITYERKRTERSRKPVLLMLLEMGDSLSGEAGGQVLANILSSLSLATRDTDVTGWYRNQSVVGIMFTETGMNEPGAFMATMMHRVGETLRFSSSLGKASEINISMHVFPESWNHETSLGNPTLYPDLENRENIHRKALALKRAIDIVGSLAAIVFLAPLFLLVAALVKLSSRGPILFTQERVGQFGKTFTFLKFRSMYVNNDHKIHQDFMKRVISGDHKKGSKMENDPRITRVGRFLRKSSLDELPQFFSVLKGDMSLVGPRPPLPYEVKEYDIWHRRRVLEVKPGITGMWQVAGRSRLRFDEMVRLDLQYVRTWSPWLDLKILFKTPIAVIRGGDAF
jgi:aspartate kinase